MSTSTRFTFDARDEDLRQQGLAFWKNENGPRVGDFVILPDGTEHRISTKCGKSFQLAEPRYGASFHWAWWYCSYSGGHKPVLHPLASLEPTQETRDGHVWVFHHDIAGAHRGVHCTIPCRVYRLYPTSESKEQP